MPAGRSALRNVRLDGTGTVGATNEDLQWMATGVTLDSERPRAILIENADIQMPTLSNSSGATAENVTAILGLSTGRVDRTASAPRNRLMPAFKSIMTGRPDANIGLAGIGVAYIRGDTIPLMRGTLWVAPWIGLIQTTGTGISGISPTALQLTYRVVDIDFDLQHALWDQLDECTDGLTDWWNV